MRIEGAAPGSESRPRLLSGRVPHDYEPNAWASRLDALRRAGTSLLDLTGTNPTRAGLSGPAPEALTSLQAAALAAYDPEPRGLRRAREAVAGYYVERAREGGPEGAHFAPTPDDIVLTAGTSEAYAHLFRLLCDPGDRVLAPRPSYPLFAPLAALEGVELDTYRLAYDGRWRLDLDSVEAGLRPGTRAVVVVEPNNPTGSCLATGERDALERLCERHRAALIADEVFGDFPWLPRTTPLPSLLGERRVPTFVLSGLSKLCGLPQLKCSWIVAAGPKHARQEALDGLEWIADLFLTVGSPVMLALPGLLEERLPFGRRVAARIDAARQEIAEATADGGLELLAADGGWSAVVRSVHGAGGELGGPSALERGVILHPAHFYDLPDDRSAVVSLLTEPQVVREALGRLLAPA
jgi:hypothetical protein